MVMKTDLITDDFAQYLTVELLCVIVEVSRRYTNAFIFGRQIATTYFDSVILDTVVSSRKRGLHSTSLIARQFLIFKIYFAIAN